MAKIKKGGTGFSQAAKTASIPTPQNTQGRANHVIKEQQAAALIGQGRLQEAEAIYRELIATGTPNPFIYNGLGVLMRKRGNLKAAIESYSKAIGLNPNIFDAHYNLGNALKEQGDLPGAIVSYKKAVELNPSSLDAHYNLGNALQEQGDFTAAIASYKKVLELNPSHPGALNNLGYALQGQGDLKAAISAYSKSLKLNPSHPYAHHNLGNALVEQGDLDAAIAAYNKALALNPSFPGAHCNLGNALMAQGDPKAAISAYNKALELDPNAPSVSYNLSLTHLSLGEYKIGWTRFDARFLLNVRLDAKPKCPPWRGEHLGDAKKLLLITEQGFGDTLQFMRYILELRRRGIGLSLCAPEKLHSLIQASGLDPNPLTPEQASAVTDGYHLPLMSLPMILGVTPESPLVTDPYIKTTSSLTTKWRDILSGEQRPIIGINWQGNPNHEKSNLSDRSLPLEVFAPIAQQANISLLSLQKGFGSEQLETCSFRHRFVSCQQQVNETWDFLETAAIFASCDLIITSDTSVAHLAGGMGRPTWLLLKKVPDWRWGLEGDTTFWYPSMRLFRQRERGNWDEVLQRVAEALLEEFPAVAVADSDMIQIRQTETAETALPTPKPLPPIQAPISLGELIDKITILQIKTRHLQGVALGNAEKELAVLGEAFDALDVQVDPALIRRLKEVNADLWRIEDDIRDKERSKDFGEDFICLARSVYQKNDLRAAIKKEINTTYGSSLVEEKSYQHY